MEENTMKLVEKLANKLGTTSEYLWSVLLKQAPIDATTTLFQILFIWGCAFALIKTHIFLSAEKDGMHSSLYDEYELSAVMPMTIAFFVVGGLVIMSIFCFEDVIAGYFNPEYWALNKILSTLNK